MDARKTVLNVAILATAAALGWKYRAEIKAAIGLGEVSPEHLRAIEIAKSGYDLDTFRTNHDAITARLADREEQIEVIGWQAEAVTRGLFRVEFAYRVDGVREAFHFEVDVGSLRCRIAPAPPR